MRKKPKSPPPPEKKPEKPWYKHIPLYIWVIIALCLVIAGEQGQRTPPRYPQTTPGSISLIQIKGFAPAVNTPQGSQLRPIIERDGFDVILQPGQFQGHVTRQTKYLIAPEVPGRPYLVFDGS